MAMRLTFPQMDLRASCSFLARLHFPMFDRPRLLMTNGRDSKSTTTFLAQEMKKGSVPVRIYN